MLNWEQIAERIQNPHLCSAEEIPELKDLCEKYPYSQVFPMLYLKVLSDVKYIHFEEELEKFAYRITDRVQLYNLLNTNHPTSEIISVDETVMPIEVIDQIPEVENEQEELQSSNKDSALNVKEEEFIIEDIENSSEDSENSNFNLEILDSSISENNELEQQILAASLSNSYQIDERVEEEIIENLPVFDLSTDNLSDEKNLISEKKETKSIDLTQNRSFIEWLKITSDEESTNNEFVEEAYREDDYEVTYIEFEKPKKEFFSPIKKAKESLNEETLPVSETLAKIYEVQGNIPKAIFVYEQLSLIIPEKKTYFASQIKKLKKKLN